MIWSTTYTLPSGVRVSWATSEGHVERVSVIGAADELATDAAVYAALELAGCQEYEDLDLSDGGDVTWESGEAADEQVAILVEPMAVSA